VSRVEGRRFSCPNVECPEQVKEWPRAFANKGAMNIEGIGDAKSDGWTTGAAATALGSSSRSHIIAYGRKEREPEQGKESWSGWAKKVVSQSFCGQFESSKSQPFLAAPALWIGNSQCRCDGARELAGILWDLDALQKASLSHANKRRTRESRWGNSIWELVS